MTSSHTSADSSSADSSVADTVLPGISPAPDGVDPEHWAQLGTADAVRTYIPGQVMSHHQRLTIQDLILPACGLNTARMDQVIDVAIRDREPISCVWLRLRTEWDIRDRLLNARFETPAGDEVALTERPDGDFTLSVTQHDGDHGEGHAMITVPFKQIHELAATVATHQSPVPRTADNTDTADRDSSDRTENP